MISKGFIRIYIQHLMNDLMKHNDILENVLMNVGITSLLIFTNEGVMIKT
jgi:hypothetical protein